MIRQLAQKAFILREYEPAKKNFNEIRLNLDHDCLKSFVLLNILHTYIL